MQHIIWGKSDNKIHFDDEYSMELEDYDNKYSYVTRTESVYRAHMLISQYWLCLARVTITFAQ